MATSVKLDDELKGRVQKLAGQRRRSAHWIMREAIEQYVTREEHRVSFLQEALASQDSYRKTGLHLTWEEFESWLMTWGTEGERSMPDCHE